MHKSGLPIMKLKDAMILASLKHGDKSFVAQQQTKVEYYYPPGIGTPVRIKKNNDNQSRSNHDTNEVK